MSTETDDPKSSPKSELDAIEAAIDANADPGALAPKLRTLLAATVGDPSARARTLRLMGVVKNRLSLPQDALADLVEARRSAIEAKDYGELANIAREASVVYAWRGNDRSAALELLQSLAFAFLQEDHAAMARALAEAGRIELEGGRYERACMLFRAITDMASRHLPERQANRLKINFCQALNRTGKPAEALTQARDLIEHLPAAESRLAFLARIEQARALAALGQVPEAEKSLGDAQAYIDDGSDAFRRLEYLETKGEIELLKNEPSAIETLQQVAREFTEQDLIARAANVRVKLGNALLKAGRNEEARAALAAALRRAIVADLTELADRIRSDMIKSDGGKHLKEFAEDIESIGGGAGVARRFILLGRLGKGGGGEVQKALDLSDGDQVALKKLDLAAYGQDRRQFVVNSIKAEYGAAIGLNHPGIAKVRDLLIEPRGEVYIVQEFIDGPTLRQLYDSGAKTEQRLALLADVAEALAALHAKGVVHRDVKPENVVVRGGKWPVLIDLGIALVAGSTDALERFGTPPYVAPEQARGGKVDFRADIYALGQMIVEIWGAKLPGPFPFHWFGQRPQAMPPALGRLARRMLRANPERRYCDLKIIAASLRAEQVHSALAAEGGGPAQS
jgi:tetratricopeptide (TPR) repeat protein